MNLTLLFPEWVTVGIFLILLLREILERPRPSEEPGVSNAALFSSLAGAVLIFLSVLPFAGKIGAAFGGMFLLDPLASFFKVFFSLVLLGVTLMSGDFFRGLRLRSGEYFLLLWCAVIGLFFLVSANDLLLLFLALEMVTLSFYVLTAYVRREPNGIEAGLKYLVLGSLASAVLIFGIALIYVGIGSTALPDIRIAYSEDPGNKFTLLGILLVLAGFGFKVAAVPFHLWVPDVYQGAPTPVAAFLSVGSKAAGFAVLLRLLFTAFLPFESNRVVLFSALAAMTLLYGNLGALLQNNIKRLFGYSSIGHAGYLLIGLAAGKASGTTAVLYYLAAYAVTNLTAFWIITLVGREMETDDLKAYRGLAQRSPFLAGCFFVALLSLAGVPPLGGFFGKFLILLAAVKENLGWLAFLGALGVPVSLYYYLGIVRTMYLEEPDRQGPISVLPSTRWGLVTLVLGILLIGIWQAPFLGFCSKAAAALF